MPLDCGILCFPSERKRNVEKLWRRRTIQSADEKRARRRFNRLLKAFDTEDLAAILKSVQTSGRDIKQCAPGPPMDIKEEIPECSKNNVEDGEEEDEGTFQDEKYEDTGLIPQIDKPMSMPYLCCKLWRWKDLQVDAALHRLDPLPWCRFGRVTLNNTTVSCCNPYHYALWIVAESESGLEEPHMSGYVNGGVVAADHTMETADTGYDDECTMTSLSNANNVGSSLHPPVVPLDSSISNLSASKNHPRSAVWAQMFRWAEKQRMDEGGVKLSGEFVAVGLLANAVHDGQNVCSEWDLKNLVSFALIRQPHKEIPMCEEVWLYNSGTKPLFFSTSSQLNSQKSETIRRVTPGYCYKVHKFYGSTGGTRVETKESKNSICCLNISVGKGWGEDYRRRYHTDTPCRYEVIFFPTFLMNNH